MKRFHGENFSWARARRHAVAAGLTPDRRRQRPRRRATAPAPPTRRPNRFLLLNETEHAFVVAAVNTFDSGRRTVAVGERLRLCRLYRPPACQRLWRRRQNVPRRTLSQRQARAGLSAPADAGRFITGGIAAANGWSRKTYGQDFDRLEPDKRIEALKAMQEGKADSAVSVRGRSSPACWRSPWKASSAIRSTAAIATRCRGRCWDFRPAGDLRQYRR